MHLHLKTAHSIIRSLQTIRTLLITYLEDIGTCILSCFHVADTGDLGALSAAARSTQIALRRVEDMLQSQAPRLLVLAEERVSVLDTGKRINQRIRFLRADVYESQAQIGGGGLSRREKEVHEEQIAKDMSRIQELAREVRDFETEVGGRLEGINAEWAVLVKEATNFLDESVSLLMTGAT